MNDFFFSPTISDFGFDDSSYLPFAALVDGASDSDLSFSPSTVSEVSSPSCSEATVPGSGESDDESDFSGSDSDVMLKKKSTKKMPMKTRASRGKTGRRRLTYTAEEKHAICVFLLAESRFRNMERVNKKDKAAMCIVSDMEGKRVLKMLDNARNHPFGPEQEKVLQRLVLRELRKREKAGKSLYLSHEDIAKLAERATINFLAVDEVLLVQPRVIEERVRSAAANRHKCYRVRKVDSFDTELFPLFAAFTPDNSAPVFEDSDDSSHEDDQMILETGVVAGDDCSNVASSSVQYDACDLSFETQAIVENPMDEMISPVYEQSYQMSFLEPYLTLPAELEFPSLSFEDSIGL